MYHALHLGKSLPNLLISNTRERDFEVDILSGGRDR
jgi:hypothetical protein